MSKLRVEIERVCGHECDELRMELAEARAEIAKLRSTPTAFLMERNDELHQQRLVLREFALFAATTCFVHTDQYQHAVRLGLIDASGNPTALLTGEE